MEETLLLLNIFYMDGGKQSPVGFMVTFWQLYFFSYTYYYMGTRGKEKAEGRKGVGGHMTTSSPPDTLSKDLWDSPCVAGVLWQ